jgi:predicted RNA-binding protein with PIN domain
VAQLGYDPEADLENSPDSVFCAHGAGFNVKWYDVPKHMHLPSCLEKETQEEPLRDLAREYCSMVATDKELLQIFERTYGPVKSRAGSESGLLDPDGFGADSSRKKKRGSSDPWGLEKTGADDGADERPERKIKPVQPQDHYLLVDGYNIVFAWEDLRQLALRNIKSARDKLMDILSNFAGYRSEKVILVFDAYKVAGGQGEVLRWHNIDVVYTKEAETADLYIEKTAHVLAKKYRVTVATSDAIEQVIIFGAGAFRMSAQMLLEEIIFTEREMREQYGIGTDE